MTPGSTSTANTFVAGVNYTLFSGLLPNASGQIVGTLSAPPSNSEADFNGLQLVTVVPEPATLAAVATAGLVVLRRRRA